MQRQPAAASPQHYVYLDADNVPPPGEPTWVGLQASFESIANVFFTELAAEDALYRMVRLGHRPVAYLPTAPSVTPEVGSRICPEAVRRFLSPRSRYDLLLDDEWDPVS